MSEPMEALVRKMRADFALVAEERKRRGDWSAEDEAEIGQAIAAAVKANDPDMISCWACWLADLAHSITAWQLLVRGSIARMRHQAREEREKREQGKGAKG